MESVGGTERVRTAEEAGLSSPSLDRGAGGSRAGGKAQDTTPTWGDHVTEDKERTTRDNAYYWCNVVGCKYHQSNAARLGRPSSFPGNRSKWSLQSELLSGGEGDDATRRDAT
jgi:hypothetical protein